MAADTPLLKDVSEALREGSPPPPTPDLQLSHDATHLVLTLLGTQMCFPATHLSPSIRGSWWV